MGVCLSMRLHYGRTSALWGLNNTPTMWVYTYYGTPTLHTQEHPHNVALVGMCVFLCVLVLF